MKNFIYEIKEEMSFNHRKEDSVEYRVMFKKLFRFLWFEWYSYQREGCYISKDNKACGYKDAFVAKSKEELDAFLTWVKSLDGTFD